MMIDSVYEMTGPLQLRDKDLVTEQIRIMRDQEATTYSPRIDQRDRISNSKLFNGDERLENYRRQICEWKYEVADYYNLDREVVSIALHYLDQYILILAESSGEKPSDAELPLVAITCLYVAVKLHGENEKRERCALSIDNFEGITDGAFKRNSIESMERRILDTLDWRVNPPTAARFLRYLKHFIPPCSDHDYDIMDRAFEGARFFSEITACSGVSILLKPSTIAVASISSALDSLPASMRLSEDVRVDLFDSISNVMSLHPDMKEVSDVRKMFRELWVDVTTLDLPRGLEAVETSNSKSRGSSSPVCVKAERRRAYKKQRKYSL